MAFDFMTHTKALWERGGALALPAATTLSAYLKNILEHPQELRYRRIPADGKVFTERVARCAGATDVLLASGFALETLAGARVWILRERNEPRERSALLLDFVGADGPLHRVDEPGLGGAVHAPRVAVVVIVVVVELAE